MKNWFGGSYIGMHTCFDGFRSTQRDFFSIFSKKKTACVLQEKLVWKEERVSVSYQGRCDSILSKARAEVWLHRVHSTWFNIMPYLHVVWVWRQGMFGLLFRCYVIVELKSNSVRDSSIGILSWCCGPHRWGYDVECTSDAMSQEGEKACCFFLWYFLCCRAAVHWQ